MVNIQQRIIGFISRNSNLGLPSFHGEPLYIPFVGAIITRKSEGVEQILVQLRHKASDRKYKDVIEIPGGKLRAYEDVYDNLKREVKEECGLDITSIDMSDQRVDISNRLDTSSIIKPFCVTQMKEGPFIGLIFLCKASGNLLKSSNETKEIKWISLSDLQQIIKNTPEQIYTAFLAPLKKYLALK